MLYVKQEHLFVDTGPSADWQTQLNKKTKV